MVNVHELAVLHARAGNVALWIADDGATAAVSAITTWICAVGFVHR